MSWTRGRQVGPARPPAPHRCTLPAIEGHRHPAPVGNHSAGTTDASSLRDIALRRVHVEERPGPHPEAIPRRCTFAVEVGARGPREPAPCDAGRNAPATPPRCSPHSAAPLLGLDCRSDDPALAGKSVDRGRHELLVAPHALGSTTVSVSRRRRAAVRSAGAAAGAYGRRRRARRPPPRRRPVAPGCATRPLRSVR